MQKRYAHIFFCLGLIAAILCFGSSASAQFYFGKNKVQYASLSWRVMTTKHFRIYFYEEEEFLAQVAARIAEDSYVALSRRFNHEIFVKIPLVVYSSHLYFTQTNTTQGFVSESTGGFTEFLKGRMVLPFTGSYADFDHVIRHELTHVFTISKFNRVQAKQRLTPAPFPPLWFVEGLAEYWSTNWDSQGEMILRDMVISGGLLRIDEFYRVQGTFAMYKLGQSVCEFINDTYGADKLTLIFENYWKGRRFEEVVKLTLGESLEEVSERWRLAMMRRYYPLISSRNFPSAEATPMTYEGYAVKAAPIKYDNGDGPREWVVYKADKLGYSSIYLMDGRGEKEEVHTILRGERSGDYESLYLLASGIDATDSGLLVFSARSGPSDAIHLFDLHTRKVIRSFRDSAIVSMQSPRFSPDGRKVVFSGAQKSGAVDLFLLDLNNSSFRRLTDDFYIDSDPVFTLAGDSVVFSSDRGAYGDRGARDLCALSLGSGRLTQLTNDSAVNRYPEVGPEGVYFVSNRDGVNNIYLLDSDSLRQVTTLLTGAFDPRLSPDGKSLLFSAYQDMRFRIYRTKGEGVSHFGSAAPAPDSREASEETLAHSQSVASRADVARSVGAPTNWRPATLSEGSVESSVNYESDYALDIAQSAVSYDQVFGALGGVQVYASDMLGDNVFYGIISNSAQTSDEIFSSWNIGVSYFNLTKRLNWGAGVFHLYDEFENPADGPYFQRQAGAYGQVSYPLSRFKRLESSMSIRYDNKDRFLFGDQREAILASNYASYVADNSIWEATGPIDGRRVNLTVGATTSLSDGRIFSTQALGDFRNYYRLGQHSAVATRLFGYTSVGDEPQRIYHGGSWSFRGFDRRHWYVPHVLFLSNELRFPLVNRLIIGTPLGGLRFGGIQGAIFYDNGYAWEEEMGRLQGAYGMGFRVGMAGVVNLRFDWAYRTDYVDIDSSPEFEFFFGWNF